MGAQTIDTDNNDSNSFVSININPAFIPDEGKETLPSQSREEEEGERNMKDRKEERELEDDKKEEIKPLPFKQLFRYSTSFEKFLMFIGILAAFISGICLPFMIILFGRLTNAFIYEDFTNIDVDEMLEQHPNFTVNQTVEDYPMLLNITKDQIEDAKEKWGIGDFHHSIVVFGVGVTIIGVIQLITGYIFVTTLNYSAESQIFRLRGLFFQSILRQEIGWFDVRKTNDFASRVTEDINKMQEGMGEKIGMFIFFMTTFVASIINAFVHGWQLTLVILSVFPLLGLSAGLMAKVQTNLTAKELEQYAMAGGVAEEALSSIRTVVSYGGETKEVERYEKNLIDANAAGIKRGLTTGAGLAMVWFFIWVSYALAFWYGTKLILDSRPPQGNLEYEPSDLIVVFFSVLMGAMNVGQSSPYLEAFNVARGAAASIYAIIERPSEMDPYDTKGKVPRDIKGKIEFKHVHFNYPSRPSVNILQGVNLQIYPSKTVALVGASGCGKSTCVQLMQRFYDPHQGQILLDEEDIRELNIGWLRDQIGVVNQEPILFATTIEENIRFGKEDATIEEIQMAAKEANAHDFIMKLPKKYATHVGDRGTQISGGQKQRIAIARALIKKPKVLLLDEATSALDNESEAIVQRALDKAREGRTTIIVAHRLSTIRNADLIVVFRDGSVVETGTHDDLMKKDGIYKSLVKAQLSPQYKPTEEARETQPYTNGINGAANVPTEDEIPSTTKKYDKSSRRSSSTVRRKSDDRRKSKVQDENDEESMKLSRWEIIRLNSPEWHYIMGGIICAAIQGCVMPIYAILFGNVLGTLTVANAEDARKEANKYSLLFLVMGIVASLSMFIQTYMFTLSGEALTMRLRKGSFVAMLRQEMGWFDDEKNSVGALCSRLSGDASNVQGATGTRIGILVQSVVVLSFSMILALVYNARLGAVGIPFVPFVVLAVYLQMKIVMGQSISEMEVLQEAVNIAVEAIGNIRTVAGLHREKSFVDRYISALSGPHYEALKKSHIRGLAFGFSNSVMFFAYAVIMFYGGHLVEIGDMEFEEVFKVAEALIFGTFMVGQAVAMAPNYGKAKVSAGKIVALLNRRPVIDASAGVGLRMTGEVKGIAFSEVNFSYPTRPTIPILREMSLRVNRGETVALVGSSGCGKSTVINLLERFYDPKSGAIRVNDNDITGLNVGYVRSLFGLVSQEPVLFDRTISENIAYGDNTRTFSQEDIELVAKQANIHNFVSQLPDKYDTRVGAKGTQLSGGQKQRIAVARALIRNPQVLLLDEATSALDAESEKIVQSTLDEVQKGRTSIIIAHRLSTIRGASKILVVEAGNIVEEGTHEDLLAIDGHYSSLYKINQ